MAKLFLFVALVTLAGCLEWFEEGTPFSWAMIISQLSVLAHAQVHQAFYALVPLL